MGTDRKTLPELMILKYHKEKTLRRLTQTKSTPGLQKNSPVESLGGTVIQPDEKMVGSLRLNFLFDRPCFG
jgi:hypothetical protein